MNISRMRATFAVISALAMLSLAVPSSAQQKMAPAVSAVQGGPAATQSPAAPPPAAAQAPAPSAAAAPVVSSLTPDAAAAPADGDSKLLKPASNAGMRELSPWSMFLSADIIVKAVMIGLAFASLVTWTIFIAKMIELSIVQRKLRSALAKIGDAALAGGSADSRSAQKTRRAVVFARGRDARGAAVGRHLQRRRHQGTRGVELCRDRSARRRAASGFGMGLLATIGATSPFVGLFGTVWGIMNSFIGISKSQTTNLAVVAPGIAEALLATAIGLVAAIPAVIIYNHFARGRKPISNWSAAPRARRDGCCRATSTAPMVAQHSRAAE